MYNDILIQLGLNDNEARAYNFLLENGTSPAGQIIKKTPLKRGVAYNALDSLLEKGLIIKGDKRGIAYFEPAHPEKLRQLLEAKEQELSKAKSTLEANLAVIVSDFNLVSGKPGVRYFEGLEGVKKVLDDSLTSQEEICTYADAEAVIKYIDKINQQYVQKREKAKIKKRIIVTDSSFTRQYLENYHRGVTNTRLISRQKYPFNAVMQIYGGKISYITLSQERMIGIIIEDKSIYQMHKALFDSAWDKASPLSYLPPLSKAQ
jgi:sugar-specific transcriptional regulator TrmB